MEGPLYWQRLRRCRRRAYRLVETVARPLTEAAARDASGSDSLAEARSVVATQRAQILNEALDLRELSAGA